MLYASIFLRGLAIVCLVSWNTTLLASGRSLASRRPGRDGLLCDGRGLRHGARLVALDGRLTRKRRARLPCTGRSPAGPCSGMGPGPRGVQRTRSARGVSAAGCGALGILLAYLPRGGRFCPVFLGVFLVSALRCERGALPAELAARNLRQNALYPGFAGVLRCPLDVIRCHWMSLDVTGLTVFGILWAYYWHTDHGPPCARRCRSCSISISLIA